MMTAKEIKSLLQRAKDSHKQHKNRKAEKLARKILDSLGKSKMIEFQVDALIVLSNALSKQGKIKEGLKYSEKAVTLSEKLTSEESKVLQARAYGENGSSHYFMSNFHEAILNYEKSIRLDLENKERISAARMTSNVGNVFWRLGDYEHALDNYEKALLVFYEYDEKRGIAETTQNIANIYFDLSNYSRALEYYKIGLEISKAMGNKYNVELITSNITNVYIKLKDLESALICANRSLELSKELNDHEGITSALSSLADIFLKRKDYDKAMACLHEAVDIDKARGDSVHALLIELLIGEIFVDEDYEGHDLKKAENIFLKALKEFEKRESRKNLSSVHKALADIYAKCNRWKKAFYHFQKYHGLNAEIADEDAREKSLLLDHRQKIENAERDRQVKLARHQEQEKILHNILPSEIANRMVEGETTIADSYDGVSVFFSDIVGFTKLSANVSAEALVVFLNEIFRELDQIAVRHGLEKIKTIGDAYMAVAGAPRPQKDHAKRAALFSLEVNKFIENYRTPGGKKIHLRIGLHSGNAVAGIIGESKFAYDLWGDAVNVASRMETYGEPGKIHVTETFVNAQDRGDFKFIENTEMEIKGKGKMKTYFLLESNI